jgi:hypothetical protein
VHCFAFAQDLKRGFTNAGESVTVFDPDATKPEAAIKVGGNPDAILYEVHEHKLR